MKDNNYIQGRAEREGVCVEGGEGGTEFISGRERDLSLN